MCDNFAIVIVECRNGLWNRFLH